MGYKKTEEYDLEKTEKMSGFYQEILKDLGENPEEKDWLKPLKE